MYKANINIKIVAVSLFVIFFIVLQVNYVDANSNKLDRATNVKVKIKDYGVRGHVFPIIEESLLEIIVSKLTSAEQDGLLATMQDEFKKKAIEKISRPTPVQGIVKATKNRSWNYDPSFTQKLDIKDHTGKVIIQAGTRVNPLEKLGWGKALIFIDGDDKAQVAWAKTWIKTKAGKLVLTKGSPIELTRELNQDVFFDQASSLTTRFRIKAVPALVEQADKLLKVSEIKI